LTWINYSNSPTRCSKAAKSSLDTSWVYWAFPGYDKHNILGRKKSPNSSSNAHLGRFPFLTIISSDVRLLPSGKHTKNYGKSPFLKGTSTISMAIFNSFLYVYQRVSYPGLVEKQLFQWPFSSFSIAILT
jgi:hypothetical protein